MLIKKIAVKAVGKAVGKCLSYKQSLQTTAVISYKQLIL